MVRAFFGTHGLFLLSKYLLIFSKCDIIKAANCRSRLLAYFSFSYVQTMQNGEVDLKQIPII